MALNRKWKGTN